VNEENEKDRQEVHEAFSKKLQDYSFLHEDRNQEVRRFVNEACKLFQMVQFEKIEASPLLEKVY
jgi:hypothetical protein